VEYKDRKLEVPVQTDTATHPATQVRTREAKRARPR
jgi:hypothetical protein